MCNILHTTRLQQFLDRENVRPGALAREAGYSRQHLLRLRRGTMEPTRTSMLALARACSRLLGRAVRAEELFDLDPSLENRTILLVDDDASVAEGLRDLLELEGWSVHVSDDVADALKAAGAHPPALAIVDIGLGRQDGRELGARLRETRPSLPLVFMSGHLHDARELGAIAAAPATRFLAKPFSVDRLLNTMEEVLGESRD